MNDDLRIAPTIENVSARKLVIPALTAVNHATAKTVARVRHLECLVDEPVAKGGEDSAPTPLETALLALVGCEAVIIKGVAGAMKFAYSGARFECEGQADLRGARGVKGIRPYFERVRLVIEIATEESDARLDKLRFNVETRCPVMNLFRDAGVEVSVDWCKIDPAALGGGASVG